MNKEPVVMRGFKKVYMVTILEGQGIEQSPYREVKYFYDDETDQLIARHDPVEPTEKPHNPNL